MPKLTEIEACLATKRGACQEKIDLLAVKKRSTAIQLLQKLLDSKRIIEQQLSTSLNNKLIAKKVGLSESSLSKLFYKVEKKSINNYIQERRALKAKFLLKLNKRNILEVSDAVGYESLAAFYKLIKKRFHKSPIQLKNAEMRKN